MEAIRAAMGSVAAPGPRDIVHKDECAFSFDSPESHTGLYTSLSTWRSFGRDHIAADFARHGNPLYLKHVWRRVPVAAKDASANGDAEKAKPEKLAIGVAGGFDVDVPKFDVVKKAFVVCMPDIDTEIPAEGNDELPMSVSVAVDAILKHEGAHRQQAIAAAWEEEDRKVSRYAADLPFVDNGKKISPDPSQWVCEDSGMHENLWLNLSTGYIGSGRKNWDGTGGTGAGLKHYKDTGHKYPLAVKLGTITPNGADVYSYAPDEDDMVLDPKLAEHLARWGISMQKQEKTEKTMAELQIDLNASYEFDKITESGADLVKLAGPGYIGLDNLGNSCYMASVLQLLFSLPILKERYVDTADAVFASAPEDPSSDLITMLTKVGVGLATDRYAHPIKTYATAEEAEAAGSQKLTKVEPYEPSSVRPLSFKTLIGKGHPEFGTSRQQDASEFFQHLLESVSRAERTGAPRVSGSGESGSNDFVPTSSMFKIEFEDRWQCNQSGKVKYTTRPDNLLSLAIPLEAATNKDLVEAYEERKQKKQKMDDSSPTDDDPVKLHVPFDACLEKLAATESIPDFMSSATGEKGLAQKRARISAFPEYLMVQLSRYVYVPQDQTTKKLDAHVAMPEELDLEHLRGTGLVEGEELLPEDLSTSIAPEAPTAVVPNPAIIEAITGMGYSENGAKRAAMATGNSNPDAAAEWVFAHMEDPDFNDPLPEPEAAEAQPEVSSQASPGDVAKLTEFGFTPEQASAALKATSGNIERAGEWLFSRGDDLDAAVAEQNAIADGEAAGDGGDEAPSGSGQPAIDGPAKYSLVGFASHIGSNTACGHYVAHVKKEGRFVLYNDEKVAVSQSPPLDLGFLYLYKRKS